MVGMLFRHHCLKAIVEYVITYFMTITKVKDFKWKMFTCRRNKACAPKIYMMRIINL